MASQKQSRKTAIGLDARPIAMFVVKRLASRSLWCQPPTAAPMNHAVAIGSHARITVVCVMHRAPTEAPRRSRKFQRTPVGSARHRLRSIGDPTLYFITSFRADETLLVAHCLQHA